MSRKTITLVGNPNSGKSTLFNALTGARQRVGNWPGVTVECKSGLLSLGKFDADLIDLPGLYSLVKVSDELSLDAEIACDSLLSGTTDVIVNIIDASNLERHLYLTTQLLEMGKPVVVALNMLDVARRRGINIDIDQLSRCLDCPVVAIEANKHKGLDVLKKQIISTCENPVIPSFRLPLPEPMGQPDSEMIRALECDSCALFSCNKKKLDSLRENIGAANLGAEPEVLIADARYQFASKIVKSACRFDKASRKTFSSRLDSIILNRFLGVPIFFAVMYAMFFVAVNVGGAFQDFFDIASETIFVDGFAQLLERFSLPEWGVALLSGGAGRGINTVLTFVPVIASMFLCLAFLESSGYMARATFVVDRFMRMLGLPGRSFAPMIVGFGCNIPAVMAARTLDNERDRILTIMMSPFMSCSARLAIFAVFVTAFFPHGGHNIIFSLYLIGILIAVFTGFLLRKTLLRGESSRLVMELPPYHLPTIGSLMRQMGHRLNSFILRAGIIIVPLCVLLGLMNGIELGEVGYSPLELVGQKMTHFFAPMGITEGNWPATVGLLTGILAKEVVVGTLNSLYAQVGNLSVAHVADFHFWVGIKEALLSIPQNFAALGHALLNPLDAAAPAQRVHAEVYGQMYQFFDGKLGAYAYLLFVLLYIPCVSTYAVMAKELNHRWAAFSVAWSVGLAYLVAVLFYQVGKLI